MARIAGIAGASGIDATELLRSIGVSAAFCATYPVDVSLAAGPGAQCFDDGRWGVVFNGRIYNPEDLPPAPGDAERVAAGVMRFGIADVLARINGDFALAIFDKAAGRQYLARDRFGIKPLYYSRVGNNLAFASRSRALFAVPGVSRAVRPEYLAVVAAGHYRFFDIEPARSPYRKIDQLPPGHFLTWRQGTATVARYSNFDDREEFSEPIAERAAEYRALFRDAVARRLKHARRPAFTLSGGLDSSSVVTVAGALAGRKQAAISTIYADASYDESREIRDVIDAGIVEWHPVKIECPDLMSLVADMVRFHDEPVATVTWMTHCLLARAAQARGHDALFGGLGGDEQHAGEYDYFYYFFADLLVAGDHARLEQEIAAWIRNHDHPVFRKNTTVAHDMMTALTDSGTPG
ncbi:MAG: asparagine synthase, partial [Alphaproteobacteria bacterium]|nr:asparagine synthase [Alphaproteobacteria bacterium]